MSMKIYHNPRCSKSRQTLQLLLDRGIQPEVIDYLNDPPSVEELNNILELLKLEPRDLIRRQESEYKALGLDDPLLSRDDLINSLVSSPKLIERPIVVNGDKAAIGRPPEAVLAILD